MKKNINKGFTLIELLVVIAVIGLLAIVVFVAINPLEQLAKTRDAGRKSTVSQMGNALGAYATSHTGTFVKDAGGGSCTPNNWIGCMVTTGELTTVPSAVAYSTSGISACATSVVNGYCYKSSDGSGAAPTVAYARMESKSENSKCVVAGQVAYFTWSSADGRAGVVCGAAEPSVGTQVFVD